MPRPNARRNHARIPSSLLAVFGLLGLISLPAGSFNFMQPAAHAASVFTVNTTGDGADSNTADGICNDGAGNCTLRAALEQANAAPGTDTINFQIGTGVQTIVLGATLPDVSDPVVIDGSTQPGYVGTPLVEIMGKDDGFTRISWGLHITAGGSTVRALALRRFELGGILIGTEGGNDAGGNKVEACYGGLRADGVTPSSLSGYCVKINDSPNNTIGGTSAAERNVLSGCGIAVDVFGAKATGNLIQGNYIGTNAAGTAVVGNPSTGVQIANASNNTIGGDTAAARNVISGNSSAGVRIAGANAAGNVVKGNYIGTNAAGTAALPNGTGAEIFSSNNVVGGLTLTPGQAPGNLISGQSRNLQVNASGVTIQGNLIGTDASGATGFAGGLFGIVCFTGNMVVGGTQPGARNIISNVNTGIYIESTAVVQGNYIGTDPSGTAARANVLGIYVSGTGSQIGGTAAGAGNVISGNRQGILLRSGASTVQGNLIGTDASGASPLPNLETGIFIDGARNGGFLGARNSVIGGTAAGAGNRIAFNGRTGIAVGPYDSDGFFSTGNRLRGNSIYSNGLLGIDLVKSVTSALLDADGPSLDDAGDADTGPNGMQNAPTVVSVSTAGGTTSVSGRLDSTPSRTYTIDLYANASCDPSGYGEGQTYLGSTQATTNAAGAATFSGSFPTPPSPGQIFTATSTDAAGNTSEFSVCHDTNVPDAVQFTSPSYTTDEPQAARVIVTRTLGTAGAATVNYATSDITAKAGADYVAASGTIQFAPGETTKAVDVLVIDDDINEDRESFRLTLSNPTGGLSLGANTTTEVHVNDTDPVPAIFVTDSTVTEGDTGAADAAFTVTLSEASGRTVTVNYLTAAGTATAGGDYTLASGTLTFAPGETSKTVNVKVNGDTTPEPHETFNLFLSGETNSLFLDLPGVGTILNDDAAALSINDLSAGEGDSGQTAFNFTVGLPFPNVNPVSVNYATADGTAAAGSDYAAAAGTLNFAAGETTKTVTVNVNGDTANEAHETFFVNLSGASNATVADAQGQGTINNDDTLALHLSQSSYHVGESAHFVTVTVTRTGDPAPAVGVSFATSDGTASERRDYTAVSGTLQFAANETSKSFDVLLTEDAYQEPEETIQITLSNPTGGAGLGLPATATVNIAADDPTQPQPNPIDDTTNFVRQHYHDFLNREPDAAGLAFWTSEIESCGADVQCREVKRINVSAAFFLSIEFQQTGYLVYRTYKTAYGDATSPNVEGTVPVIRLQEFLRDTRGIGEGVVVGPTDWQRKLAANKSAYMFEFVQRPRFVAEYPLSMDVDEYLRKLAHNAGITLTGSDYEQARALVRISTNVQARAEILRLIAEKDALQQSEFRRAFVLMQFYGYMRRNPDDLQDTDFRGWKFWLDKLNGFDGDYVRAEMVKAFLDSDEYRKRFGL